MKKKLVLIKSFYNKILTPAVFLLIITLIAELLLVYLLGTYKYSTIIDSSFKNLINNKDALYVMQFDIGGVDESVISELETMSGIDELYTYRGVLAEFSYKDTPINVVLTNTEMFQNYDLMDAETYFSETGVENDVLQGIYVGDFLSSDSDIELSFNGELMKVNLIGKIKSPYYVPSFLNGGSKVTSYDVMYQGSDTIFIKDSPEVQKIFKEKSILRYYNNFLLIFEENLEDSEKQSVLDYLDKQNLSYSDYETIMANSEEITTETLRRSIPLPLYLVVLSTMLTWCFSVLFLHKKMELILTFYLCGCSKKNGYLIMSVALGLIGALATVINFVILTVMKIGMDRGTMVIDNFTVEGSSFVCLLCYWLILLFLSVSASLLIYRNKSVSSIRKKVGL